MTDDIEARLRAVPLTCDYCDSLEGAPCRPWGDSREHSVQPDYPALAAVVRAMVGAQGGAASVLALVHAQAEDEGLWFVAATAPEAYLQQALRAVHAAVESSARSDGSPLARLTEERDQAEIKLTRAQGALADAATVTTGNVEAGIRALTAERDRLRIAGEDMLRVFLRHIYGSGVTMDQRIKHPSLQKAVDQWVAAFRPPDGPGGEAAPCASASTGRCTTAR